MDNDAFTGGVRPGGLRNKDEIKILICYLLSQVSEPLKRDMIYSAVLHDGLVNYFEVGEALVDLEQRGNVVVTGEEYSLSQNGLDIAKRLKRELPLSVRERAVRAALYLLTRERNERENRVEITEREDGVYVECSVLDRGRVLMRLNLLVGDRMQAEQVRNEFYDHPGVLYAAAVASLSGDHKMLRNMLNEQLPSGYTDYLADS